MKVSGMRAVLAVHDALERAGLGRTSPYSGGHIAGWIEPNRYGSTGFSVRRERDGTLGWNVVLSGKPHLSYRQWEERDGDRGTITLHEPRNPERLSPRIAEVFASVGIPGAKVTCSGGQGHWDDDVEYAVATPYPEWLDAPDLKNLFQPYDGPMLRAMTFDKRWKDDVVPLKGTLAGYVVGGISHLTRESALHIVAAAEAERVAHEANVASYGGPENAPSWLKRTLTRATLSEAGEFVVKCPRREEERMTPVTLRNHWGDEVEAWRMPNAWMFRQHDFRPVVPFMLDGEMRTSVPFPKFDEQHGGDAPWLDAAPAPSPR
jgi:hypothetical protein